MSSARRERVADPAVVGEEVARAEALGLVRSAPASRRTSRRGGAPWSAPTQLRVEAELEHRPALRLRRELRVDHLVGPGAERRSAPPRAAARPRCPRQRPCASGAWAMAPTPRRIASSVAATPASVRSGSSKRSTSRPAALRRCSRYAASWARPRSRSTSTIGSSPARGLDLALDAEALEVGQVAAAEVVGEVGGGEEELGVGEAHAAESQLGLVGGRSKHANGRTHTAPGRRRPPARRPG